MPWSHGLGKKTTAYHVLLASPSSTAHSLVPQVFIECLLCVRHRKGYSLCKLGSFIFMVLININNHKYKIIVSYRSYKHIALNAQYQRMCNMENRSGQGVRNNYSLVSTIQPTKAGSPTPGLRLVAVCGLLGTWPHSRR